MQQSELNTLMQETAADAVKTAKEEFDITLDYSADSVQFVDKTITRFIKDYPSQSLENKAIFTICNMYGAYLGEVFKKHAGGEWCYDTSEPGAPSIFLNIKDRSYAFAGVCYDKLVKNPDIQVEEYFKQALAANTN